MDKSVETVPPVFLLLRHTTIFSKQKEVIIPSPPPTQCCFGVKTKVRNSRVILNIREL